MATEKYIGEAMLRDAPKKKLSLIIKDGSVTNSKIAEDSVSTDKISNKSVTNEKLADSTITSAKVASTLLNLIKAGTGMSEELIEEMESYNERLNALESRDMDITVTFTGDTTPILFTGESITITKPVTYNIITSIPDVDITWTIVEAGLGGTNKSGTVNVSFNDVGSHTFTFEVVVNYHGLIRTVSKSLTFNVCKKSYIGYSAIEDYNDIIQGESIAEGLNPVVSPNGVNGTRTITNGDTPAYLWICIPKNGNAALVHSIQQLGTLTVDIPYNTYQNDNYTFYRSITKHNIGEYTFKIA